MQVRLSMVTLNDRFLRQVYFLLCWNKQGISIIKQDCHCWCKKFQWIFVIWIKL